MMRYFTLVILLFLATNSYSQNVLVTATIGTLSGNHTTLKGAIDAVNTGTYKGYVIITVNNNTTEIASNVLNSSGTGSALYDSIKITSSGNFTVSGTITAGSPLIDLNGADNVCFEGVNSGGISLTFNNLQSSSTDSTCTIRMYKDAKKNRINNCNIYSASTANYGGAIYIGRPLPTVGTGNDSIQISNNTIAGNASGNPYKCIYIDGTNLSSGVNNNGIVINNNNITNFKLSGIYSVTGVDSLTISGNNFYQTTVQNYSVATTLTPIYINNTSTGVFFNIVNNNIGGTSANCGGTAMTDTNLVQFQAIYFNGAAAYPRSNINGNRIANININTKYATVPINHAGIFIIGGRLNCGTLQGNLIGDTTTTGSINFYLTGTTSTTFYGIATVGTSSSGTFDSIDISNNRISGISTSSVINFNVSLKAIYLAGSSPAPYFIVNNNLIGSNTVANSISNSSNQLLNGIVTSFTTTSTFLTHQITNNTIANLFIGGGTAASSARMTLMNIAGTAQNYIVSNNVIKNCSSSVTAITTSGNSAAIVAFQFTASGSTSLVVSNNLIYNLTTLGTSTATGITGMYVNTNTAVAAINKNKIFNLSAASTVTPIIPGIYAAGGVITYSNNEISLGYNGNLTINTNPTQYSGIYEAGGTNNFYFNTVAILGSGVTNTANTYALFSSPTTTTRNYRNNIFSNTRSYSSAGSTYNFAEYIAGTISSGAISGLISDYNLYNASGTGGMLITNSSNNYSSVSAWNTVAYTHDINSAAGDPNFYSNSILKPMNAVAFNGVAISGITTDIEGNTRINNRIGAYDNLTSLSVNILKFGGNWKSQNPLIQFTTSEEKNITNYSIERSENGEDFLVAGTIKPTGNNNSFDNNYSFEDFSYSGIANKLFYRIKISELSGNVYYTKTIQLSKNSLLVDASIFPNPFTNILNIENGVLITISDVTGRNCNNLIKTNLEKTLIDTESLPKGFYFVEIENRQGELRNNIIQKQ